MAAYWLFTLKLAEDKPQVMSIEGPYKTWKEANDKKTPDPEMGEYQVTQIVMKECYEENQYGAPSYPAHPSDLFDYEEDYPDGEEG